MTQQLTFDLPVRQALGRDDFFVSPSNAHALAILSDTPSWPLNKMVVCGDAGSGKTHLVHVWATEMEANIISACDLSQDAITTLAKGPLAIEDADQICGSIALETHLFHLHNLIHANGFPLLLSARTAPSRWPLSLPDLNSRMEGTAVAQLNAPDDKLLTVVMLKYFNDRQLNVSPEVINYIIKHAPRSFEFIRAFCLEVDRTALSEKRAITRPLAAKVLEALDKNRSQGA